jgi:hypothetical protein
VPLDGVGELGEPAVLLGDQERRSVGGRGDKAFELAEHAGQEAAAFDHEQAPDLVLGWSAVDQPLEVFRVVGALDLDLPRRGLDLLQVGCGELEVRGAEVLLEPLEPLEPAGAGGWARSTAAA